MAKAHHLLNYEVGIGKRKIVPSLFSEPSLEARSKRHWANSAPELCSAPTEPADQRKATGELQSLLTCNHIPLAGGLCVYAQSLQSHPTLFDPMGSTPSGSSVHGIPQARLLKWAAVPSCIGSSQPRNQICVSYVSQESNLCLLCLLC